MSTRQYPFTNVAYVSVFAAISPTIFNNGGVDTVTRVSAGVYDLTLSGGGIDEKDCIETVSVRGTVENSAIALSHTSDTVKRVTITTGGLALAADANFSARFDRVPLF